MYYFILCVRVFCLYACLCIVCLPGAHKGQKRLLDPPWVGGTDGYELSCGCWELSQGRLKE